MSLLSAKRTSRILPAAAALLVVWQTMPFAIAAAKPVPVSTPIRWNDWNEGLLDQARREHRYVILDLEAVWCHWCHVMDEQTYADPKVRTQIAGHYLAARADQDAHPDLAARYGEWGWPATIVFAPDGSEIVKRRGYLDPQQMGSLLAAIVADPSPGPSVRAANAVVPASESRLGTAQREQLLKDYAAFYDTEHGGWGNGHRYIDAPSMELAMSLARDGDARAQAMARQTLDQNLLLIDPVWGGVYQYSDELDWKSPHFEKIMSYQADDLRLYALAGAMWNEPRYRDAAAAIQRYLGAFLTSPEGAFYVSQDADLDRDTDGHAYYRLDDAGRRRLGLPRVDTHRYTRENAWAITALCQLHDSAGDAAALASATRAAGWIVEHRAMPGGGFRHDEQDRAGPYLSDNAAMAQALLSLYRSTGDRTWLDRAGRTLDFIDARLRAADAGYISAPAPKKATGVFAQPTRAPEENVALARAANTAFRATGEARYRDMAARALRYLASPALSEPGRFVPGLLLAEREVGGEPVHIAIVGAKDDPAAQALHAAALAYPAVYLQVDWWDRREGPLPNADVPYPLLPRAAAFSCTGTACSAPVFEAARLAPAVDRLTRLPAG